ncbi:MAG: 16S rRNA (guanine(527)-N(7))-methyltransferase RsmG [Methylomonas sp.]|nr:16S rRNA (guanine(527)-N(7))-methyltransferase RsmG [Methylomonas sp.]PPD20982.1 MAG: 16S rRNA (guanine(527)-N(7))-methyltransferase RsmG [Methylomonas sp.]PPD27227.1 MAG: 16S rRNA (guanine(527)-N(7))-methyltransferase RsmG [Methylomonas sp.]PPD39177.1 MAG: 16S rRNA (guanine(527)-N(7))-methyltransferase RsmG [Methylomonas sp.]PPD41336.1 MAG: 16S rRNA (guanine(527)-N(7))-methyltransferase RsmG [Methylomonas sp.]
MDSCLIRLTTGLSELSLPLSESQIDALLQFVQLLAKWNKAYNLTAVREPLAMVNLHILDSLAVLPHLKPSRIADIGTGAGLPGIPLAICRPDCRFTLVDANAKKTRFVQQAVLELKLGNVEVVHARVEQLPAGEGFDSILTRAFASLPSMVDSTRHLLADNGVLLAMKGQTPHDELAAMAADYQLIPLTVPGVDAERCLICIERLKA